MARRSVEEVSKETYDCDGQVSARYRTWRGDPIPTQRNRSDIRGDLQAEIMAAVWKLGEATVEQVRSELPAKGRPAYTTVQTVLNRLEARNLLTRVREGRAHLYKPLIEESDFVTRSLGERLAEASPKARRLALLNLVEELEPSEVNEIAQRAQQIQARRDS